MLLEKKQYKFRYIKHTLSFDGKGWHMFEDPDGCKHLVTDLHYQKYSFTHNSDYLCWVDKINCKGKIFLEPEHPNHRIGDIVELTILGVFQKKSSKMRSFKITRLQDTNGWQAEYLGSIKLPKGLPVKCKVLRIKKAVLIVVPVF